MEEVKGKNGRNFGTVCFELMKSMRRRIDYPDVLSVEFDTTRREGCANGAKKFARTGKLVYMIAVVKPKP